MPLILESSNPSPIAVFQGVGGFGATASTTAGFNAVFQGVGGMSAAGSVAKHGSATFAGIGGMSAIGRIDDEPNVFAEAAFEGIGAFSATGSIHRRGVAVFEGIGGLFADGRTQAAESATLSILLTIAAGDVVDHGRTYSARIFADGTAYPIKSFGFNESRSDAGASLDVTLQRNSDRAAIMAADAFTFDVYDNGAWVTIFEGGKRAAGGFSFNFSDGRSSDNLSVSAAAPIAERLEASPERNLTIFDPDRLRLSVSDFPTAYDTDGNAYTQQLRPVSGLTLHGLFQIVFVELCGFGGFQTTIDDFPIRRADFSITGSYLEGLGGHTGIFNPLLFVIGDVVWFLDSSAGFPEGFGSPVAITADNYEGAQFTLTELNADGYIVTYSENEADYDYTQTRVETDDPETTGHFGDPDFTERNRSTTWRDFYKSASPLIPIRSEKLSQVTETRATHEGALSTINRDNELYYYDTLSRIVRIEKRTDGLIPNLADPDFATTFDRTTEETTTFVYKGDRFDNRRQILGSQVKETRGLISKDESNPALNQPFKQRFTDAFQAGNLAAGVATEFVPIETVVETHTQTSKSQVEIKTQTTNFLTVPVHVSGSTADVRIGDVTQNAQTSGTGERYVFRPGAIRTNARMQTLSVGEMPVALAVALARRRLSKRRTLRGSVTLKGINLSIKRGSMFELFDRAGVSVGVFVCEGRSISGQNVGVPGQQKTSMVLEVSQV